MKNLSVIIDWLEFTMLHTDLTQAMKILDLDWDTFSPLAKGRYGYNHQLKWNDGNVFLMFTAKDETAQTHEQPQPAFPGLGAANRRSGLCSLLARRVLLCLFQGIGHEEDETRKEDDAIDAADTFAVERQRTEVIQTEDDHQCRGDDRGGDILPDG